jgi:hypothetical protein
MIGVYVAVQSMKLNLQVFSCENTNTSSSTIMEAAIAELSTVPAQLQILVSFEVNGETYTLTESQLENFPCQDAYLNVLWRNLKTGQLNVETTIKGEIIVKALDNGGHAFKNFALVARVYQDPTITLCQLLQVDTFLRLVEQVKSHYPATKKQVNPELLIAQYDSVNAEHYYTIEQHPSYQWIGRLGYEKLRQEFKFYGIDELPTLNPGSTHDEINPAELKDRFEKDFGADAYLQGDSTGAKFRNFLDVLRGMGGVISGSSVLKSVLQEAWESTDVDIYVTEDSLKAYVLGHHGRCYLNYGNIKQSSYLNDYETHSSTPIIRNHLRDLLHFKPEGKPSYLLGIYKGLKARGQSPQKIENCLEITIRTEIMYAVVKLLGGDHPELLSKSEVTANYNELSGIDYVIRFSFCDKRVDLVVCKCTVPFVIDNFDFGFNKVYYDGYSVNCLDWEAVSTKVTTNNYCRDLNAHNDIERYVYNIARIRKYFRRGYLVLL